MAGGEVTTVEALETTTVGQFKRLVVQALRKDEDDLNLLDLLLGEQPLLDDSATIAESGLSIDKAVMAIFKQRCVECVQQGGTPIQLNVKDRPVVLIVPDGTTEVPPAAFQGCTSIVCAIVPDSVTSIEGNAFFGCSSLTGLTIPDSVRSVGDFAFFGCSSLTSLTIPASVTSIGRSAFRDCRSLKSLMIPDSVTSMDDGALDGCISLAYLAIPRSVSLEAVFPDRPEACEVQRV